MTAALRPTTALRRPSPAGGTRVERLELSSACDDKLFFAQVREDPRVELEALRLGSRDRAVVVSSGGCTALSLLGAGAAEVHAVDTNPTQNHMVDLKVVAVRELTRGQAIGFLGGSAMSAANRLTLYARLRSQLGIDAAVYWDRRSDAIARGVVNSGVSERFIRLVCGAVRKVVHNPRRVDRMLRCETLDEQRALFEAEWNTRAWRALFDVLLNRWTMSRAYDPGFFAKVGRSNFAEHFRQVANHTLTNVPIADNYFLHQMFTGHYPVEHVDGVPPYLSERGSTTIAERRGQLLLVDGSVTDHLKTLPDASMNAFALSNVCEWLDEGSIALLFVEVERVAAPGARVIFRNFVGWTDLPAASRLKEIPGLGQRLLHGDRSATQSRVVVCTAGPVS